MGKRSSWNHRNRQLQRNVGGDEQRGVWGQRSGNPVAERHGIGGGDGV